MAVEFVIIREPTVNHDGRESHTPGKVYYNGVYFCESCEDEDRFLEKGGEKVFGRTAIPRGRYELTISFSERFKKETVEVLGVKTHSGVRIHGGNDAEDSKGCPLWGKVRTKTGVAGCKDVVDKAFDTVKAAKARGEKAYLEVK